MSEPRCPCGDDPDAWRAANEPAPTDDVMRCTCGHPHAEPEWIDHRPDCPLAAPTDDVAARCYPSRFECRDPMCPNHGTAAEEFRAELERLAADLAAARTLAETRRLLRLSAESELAAARAEAERLRYASLDWQDKYHALRRQVAAVRALPQRGEHYDWDSVTARQIDDALDTEEPTHAALDTEASP